MSETFLPLANGRAVPWAEVPRLPAASLVEAAATELGGGARLCAWFGLPRHDQTQIVCVLARDSAATLAVACSEPTTGSYPALTARQAQAHLFERELWEEHALYPEGHPWLKPVRRAGEHGPGVIDFFRVDGPEIHEVAVGPIHAGVIEPGHFRFQCAGEEVLHLEIALGYQHRGIERAFVGGPHRATLSQAETIAGDSTVAHTTAYAMVLEALAGVEAPLRAQWLRAIGLELERLANHTGDMGGLAGDVAFQPTAAACGKLRGDFLNLTAVLCGNRFGRGLIIPGGVRRDIRAPQLTQINEGLARALAGAGRASGWLWDAASVRERFDGVGLVNSDDAAEIGLVGPAARASGLVRDVRFDHPAGWHRFASVPVSVWRHGDVLARARVRWLELLRSGAFVIEQLTNPPDGAIAVPAQGGAGEQLAVAMVEAWRGELCHVAISDRDGRFRKYKIVDPSFHNWIGLALALRGQAISDFPLCNKSFNLSYCGFDL